LGLRHTVFNPLQKGFSKNDCAATELLGNSREFQVPTFPDMRRTKTIQGEVHDEKAFYCMQGASGHAGLFSTALELSVLMNVMLNNGKYGSNTFFNEQIVQDVTTPIVNPEGNRFEFATG
jgi:CubicO group peptidase (beta-lactamase class C family)